MSIEYTDLASEVYDQIVRDIQADKKIAYEVIAFLSMVSSLGPMNLPTHLKVWLNERLDKIRNPYINKDSS